MDSATFGVFLGSGICALVGSQLALFLLRGLRTYRAELAQFHLRREILQRQLLSLTSRHEQANRSVDAWQGLRKFRVDRKVQESEHTCSFYLKPHDGKPIPSFLPGQYLTFSLRIGDERKPVYRCYSLSDRPGLDCYRISIRKVMPPGWQPELPAGKVSSHFVDHVQEGDIVDALAPRGKFTWDTSQQQPIVLLAAGIGSGFLATSCRDWLDRADHDA